MGLTVLVHCEDQGVLDDVQTHQFDISRPESHGFLRPEEAEYRAVERLIEIASNVDCAVHVVHVSTAVSARAISKSNSHITMETGPQYCLFDNSRLTARNGHRFLCSPPLRSAETAGDLSALVRSGAFHVMATDHCAFYKRDKDAHRGDILRVPKGLAGIGAMPGAAFEILSGNLERFVAMLSKGPARVCGLTQKGEIRVGADADIVVGRQVESPAELIATESDAHDPYVGITTTLKICKVLLRGMLVAEDGNLLLGPKGERLCL